MTSSASFGFVFVAFSAFNNSPLSIVTLRSSLFKTFQRVIGRQIVMASSVANFYHLMVIAKQTEFLSNLLFLRNNQNANSHKLVLSLLRLLIFRALGFNALET